VTDPSASDRGLTSEEELRAITIGELSPHAAAVELVEYDPAWREVQHYADAKSAVVEEILRRAGGEAR
jgi:GrpB-like predicted nucleotidyltransferase (UPF0157 family)